MNNDKMRSEFEEWAERHTYTLKTLDGEYAALSAQILWQCWIASRAARVVELPKEPEDPCGAMPYDRGQVDAMRVMLEDCKSALDEAGVAYK